MRRGEPVDVKLCLVFPREALSVPVMRHVLGDALRDLGADDEGVADLLLAVTEACTNVVRHGGPGCKYEVVASVDRAGCLIEVLNSGPGFDPAAVPSLRTRRLPLPAIPVARIRRRPARRTGATRPVANRWTVQRRTPGARRRDAADSLPESGRGLAIMQACVDDVTLSSGPDRLTVVSLQKRIAWRSDAPLAHPRARRLRDAG